MDAGVIASDPDPFAYFVELQPAIMASSETHNPTQQGRKVWAVT